MTVHYVDVYQVTAAFADGFDIAGEVTEVGRKDTRSYQHGCSFTLSSDDYSEKGVKASTEFDRIHIDFDLAPIDAM
jgi:NADPH:quinone reductase-like Zn-dependent oxidoreductase